MVLLLFQRLGLPEQFQLVTEAEYLPVRHQHNYYLIERRERGRRAGERERGRAGERERGKREGEREERAYWGQTSLKLIVVNRLKYLG